VLNDDSGLGAKQALAAASRTSDAVIIGNAAAPEGLNELRTNPNWVMEGSVFFDLWPKCALAMVLAQADGQTLPALTEAPEFVLTKANLDQYYAGNSAIAAPTLATADAYLKPYLDKVGGPLPTQ
jgi:ABC-type sugar transport system substrate-binding protein